MPSSLHPVDEAVLVAYLVAMAVVGVSFSRFLKAGRDFLTGGNRVEWWIAGLASFMSGFSVWTFTGGAGFAYREGVIGVFLLFLAAPAFLVGWAVYATRWRRSRVATVVELVRARFGDRTHQLFSWTTAPSQLLVGSVRLFALASFLSVAVGVSVPHLVVACGGVIVLYTALGGYWAVCFADTFQFLVLFPVACLLAALSIADAGGLASFADRAPPGFLDPFSGEYGWLFLAAYVVSQTVGYNNFGNAQRYFCADTERSARKIALLCAALFALGSVVFYVPPLVARVVLPDLGAAASGLRQPSEAAYVAMGMRVLPPGLVGVLLAAMLASSMASLSAVNHVVTGILAKDVYQSYARPLASEREMLVASRAASAAVGVATIGLALLFAAGARGVFTLLFVLESIFAIPVGLPILYGMVVRRGPRWAGAAAWAAGASTSLVTSLFLRERFGLNETYLIGVPAVATTAAFFASVALGRPKAAGASEVDRLFAKLAEPIDPATELAASPMSGRAQLAIVGRVTTAVGVASLLLVPASSAPRDRAVVLAYSALTALFGLGFLLASRTSRAAATRATVPASRPDEASNEA